MGHSEVLNCFLWAAVSHFLLYYLILRLVSQYQMNKNICIASFSKYHFFSLSFPYPSPFSPAHRVHILWWGKGNWLTVFNFSHSRYQSLRSPWPAVRKQELWEQPFWNNPILVILPIQFHCAVCIYGICLKWLLPELLFSDRWSRGTKTLVTRGRGSPLYGLYRYVQP